MNHRYALMLLTQAEFIDDYGSADEAESALGKLLDSDSSLKGEAAYVEIDASGRPVGKPVTEVRVHA
jgi:hypothetical protein